MLKHLFLRLEETRFSLLHFVAAFAGIVGVRLFLEVLSSPSSTGALATDVSTIVHYTLFYAAVLAALAAILHRLLRVPMRSALTVTLFGLTLIWIAPLIDLFFSLGRGVSMAYVFASPWQLFGDFISFFGPFVFPGVTVGMRIEIFLIVALLFLYAKYHGRSFSQSILTALAGYAAIFAFVALPSLLSLLRDVLRFSFSEKNSAVIVWMEATIRSSIVTREYLHPTLRFSQDRLFEVLFNVAMSQVLFWVCGGFIVRGLWIRSSKTMRALLGNMRPARVIHYGLLILAGLLLAVQMRSLNLAWNWLDISTLLLAALGFWSAWMFAVCVNDLVDESSDQISNTDRPLVRGILTHATMQQAAAGFFLVMLLTGLLTGTYTFFFLLAFTAAYWVYSVPPLRLKRVPFLSHFLIGVACLCAFLTGFYLVSPDRSVHAIPFSILAFVLVGFAWSAHVKDFKDIAGDRSEGVLTLPVWLGDRRARCLIGAMIALVFIAAPLVFGSILWIPSFIAALLSVGICLQAKKPERGIFALYFSYALLAFFLLS